MWSNFKAEWLAWWRATGWVARVSPLLLIAMHLVIEGEPTPRIIAAALVFFTAYYLVPANRRIAAFVLPLYGAVVAWSIFRWTKAQQFIPPQAGGLKRLDAEFFSLNVADRVLTPVQLATEWGGEKLAQSARNLLRAVIPAVVFFNIHLRFFLSQRGTSRYSAWGLDTMSTQVNWAFFGASLLALVTSLVLPTTPATGVLFATLTLYHSVKFAALRSAVIPFWLMVVVATHFTGENTTSDCLVAIGYAVFAAFAVSSFWSWRMKREASVWRPSSTQHVEPRKLTGTDS